jgi:hypothetical protein
MRSISTLIAVVRWPGGADIVAVIRREAHPETRCLFRGRQQARTNRRGPDALRPLLAEDFLFEAGPMRVQGREQFLAVAAWPAGATTQMVADAYDGDHGLQLYAAANAGVTVKIAEHLTVRDGTIVATETITDRADFGAFLAAGQ